MNKKETGVILGILKTAYPNFGNGVGNDQMVDLWQTMFSDEPATIVAAAVKAFIATDDKGYPPHIGAIKASIANLKGGSQMTEIEAWQIAKKAMSAYATHEEFLALPAPIRRAVGSASQLVQWALMDMSQLPVIQSHFVRSYRTALEAENKTAMLPSDVRELIGKVAVKQLTEGDESNGSQDD